MNYLNQVGLAAKGAARGNVPGTDQRHSMAYASPVDLDEAYCVGQKAVELAAAGAERLHGHDPPQSRLRLQRRVRQSPAGRGGQQRADVPAAWIAASGCDVTDDFVRYARPLVGDDMISLPIVDGRQRLTRFHPIYAEQKLPKYVPQADRSRLFLTPDPDLHARIHAPIAWSASTPTAAPSTRWS